MPAAALPLRLHPGRPRLSPARAALVVLGAVLAQAWILALPFQLDDLVLLRDPLALFATGAAPPGSPVPVDGDVPRFMLRFTSWALWGGLRAVSSEPLSPVVFHAVGLLLHGLCALLLARCVVRLAPRPVAEDAALAAGLVFGLGAGHVQAVSWTAAWGGPLGDLCALLALEALLAAREVAGGRRLALRLAGAGCAWLSLVSKTPEVVALGVVALALVLARRPADPDGRPDPGPWPALGFLAVALALGLATRFLYLGSLRFGYGERPPPAPGTLPGLLPAGLLGLGQALYPWNRAPVFAGEAPLLARLLGERLSAPAIGALVALPWPALALLVGRGRRRALLGALFLALATLPPIAILYEGLPTNVAARAAYLPMLGAAGLIGLSVAVLAERARALVLGLATVLLGGALLDGTAHVARTELLAAAETRELAAEVDQAAREHARTSSACELAVALVAPDAGFGGIPHLGDLAGLAFRPPFYQGVGGAGEGVDVRTFASEDELALALARGELADRDVLVLGPAREAEADGSGTPGARARAARAPRRWTPLRAGARAETLPLAARADGFAPLAPYSLHAFPVLAAARGGLAGRFLIERTDGARLELPLAAPAEPGPSVRVPPAVDLLLGEPVRAVTWQGTGSPGGLDVARHLPRLEPLGPLAAEPLELEFASDAAPTFRVRRPAAAAGAVAARLTLRFELPRQPILLVADLALPAPLPPEPGELALLPTAFGDDPGPPGSPPRPDRAGYPWPLVRAELARRFDELLFHHLTFTWTLTLHRADGTPCAETLPTRARFARPGR